jgi:hypothetical protein
MSNTTGKEQAKVKKHVQLRSDKDQINKLEDIKISKSDFIFEKSGHFRDVY